MSTPGVGAGDTLSGVHIALVIIGGTIGMAVFLVSAQIGGSLGLQRAAWAFAAGCLILAVMGSLTSHVGATTRFTTYQLCAQAFGGVGAQLVNTVIALSLIGWVAVISNTLGSLSDFVFSRLYGWELPVPVYIAASSAAIVVVTISGFRGIDRIALWMTPAMLLLVVYAALGSIDQVPHWNRPVAGATPMSFSAAVSAVVGSYIAGVIIQPDYSRFARDARHAVGAAFVALGLCFPTVMFLAAIPGSALSQVDLRGLLLAMGVGLPAFTLLILGAWSSNVLCLYSSSLSMSTVIRRATYWKVVVTIGVLGTLLALVDAQTYLVNFLVLLGITIPPVGAIYLVEALLLRRAPQTRVAADTNALPILPTQWRAVLAWVLATGVGFAVQNGLLAISGVSSIDAILVSASIFLILNGQRSVFFPARHLTDA
ncbi:cytosine permease [Haliea sp.]|uniref:purine-cytosine permease family protein n=1 Tax=Haliea sp. TaxID=1932666 RepID=UPI00257C2AC2|nr:cytosine permease [Haliea sp.]